MEDGILLVPTCMATLTTRIIVLAVPDWPASGGGGLCRPCATDGSGSGRWAVGGGGWRDAHYCE